MKYQTTYKSRKIIIINTADGDYLVIRTLGCSVKKRRHFDSATQALKWVKGAIDSNKLPLNDPWVVCHW
jgi:hypothetical protein